jgi:hypothetical protein
MPQRHFFTRFVRDFKEFSLHQMDFIHYTVPLHTANTNGFQFPSEYVGQYGVYDAIKHIYNSSATLKPLVKEDHLLTNKRYFTTDTEKAVQAIREKFRGEHNIDPSAYSIFIAPGNEKNEVEYCMENLRKGVKEFLLKFSNPTSLSHKALPLDGNFVTVLSVMEGSDGEAYVKEYLANNEWYGRIVLVSDNNNQHFDAMAASDFGFIYDGQMVQSANALHLPVNCLINMRMNQQFYQNFFNRWWNDMNIICDNQVNMELIGGEAWWGKICDTIAENYVNPRARQLMMQKLDGFVVEGMSYKELDRTEVRTRDLMIDGQAYDQFHDPFTLSARRMWADIEAHNDFGQTASPDGLRV